MWKDIEWYEWIYQVSDCNEWVIKISNNRILKSQISNWYKKVWIYKNNIRNKFSEHRIVAQTFIPNPDNYPIVMHLDNDRLNNNIDNIKWWTQKENVQQCHKEKRHLFDVSNPKVMLWKFGGKHNTSKSVIQYDKESNYILEFPSISDAHISTWIDIWWISKCCKWKTKSAWWFIWRYKNSS